MKFRKHPNYATADHVEPRAIRQRGVSDHNNLILACRHCNEDSGCILPTACERLFVMLATDAWDNKIEVYLALSNTRHIWRDVKEYWCGDRKGPDWDIEPWVYNPADVLGPLAFAY